MPRDDLSPEFLRLIFSYDPETGLLHWKKRTDISSRGDRKAGKLAGTSCDKDGYLVVQIRRKRYGCHRIIVAIVTGKWPEHDVDHKNGNRTDNRWSNIRQATRQQNLRNMKLRYTNKSGYKWVSWSKVMNKWVAQIRDGKTNLNLGFFDDPAEAHEAAKAAAIVIHGEFARSV